MEKPLIGAYWGAREETRQEAANRIAIYLTAIAKHPSLTSWCLKAHTRKDASLPFEISVDAIRNHLKTNDRDISGDPIQELGFRLSLWNGNHAFPTNFRVTCGAFSNFVKNSAILSLPPHVTPTDATSGELFRWLLEKSVEAWEPDNAVATSLESIARSGSRMPWEADGWFSYRRGKGVIHLFRNNQA